MIITHETTIEEYEAWLATNPPLSQLKKSVKSVFRYAYAAFRRLDRKLQRVVNGSCLFANAKAPAQFDRHHRLNYDQFGVWKQGIASSIQDVQDHITHLEKIERLEDEVREQEECRRLRIKKVEEELIMEELFESALEILK